MEDISSQVLPAIAAFDPAGVCVCVWGGGGGGWDNWDNCGTGVRASISKPTSFIYLAFEINGPIHILNRLK